MRISILLLALCVTSTAFCQTVDYNGAVANFIPTCNYGTGRSSSIDTWVNHWIGTGTYAGAISWFNTCPGSGAGQRGYIEGTSTLYGPSSAHFVIRSSDGQITQTVKVSNTAYHCGATGYPTNNPRSIGVEHDATLANPGNWNSTPMLTSSTNMACYFTGMYSISRTRALPGIREHSEMPGTNTDCAGTIPWTTWMNMLNSSVANNCSGTSQPVPTNDNCSGSVTQLTSNTSCNNSSGTVLGATESVGPNTCAGCNCVSSDDYDVYYRFTAVATSHTVTLSNLASNFDGVIELRTSCSSGAGNVVGQCYDPTGAPDPLSRTWTGLTIGTQYYIRIFEYNYSSTPPSSPTFSICVTHTGGGAEDITVTDATVDVSSAQAGGLINVTSNQNYSGSQLDANLSSFGLNYYLSTDCTFSGSDVPLGSDASSLGSDDPSNLENEELTIPTGTGAGNYYILFVGDADDILAESNENNNVACVPITVTAVATLTATLNSASITPTTVCPCGSFTINCSISATSAISDVILGASIAPTGTTNYISDQANDVSITLPSGSSNQSRTFTIPCNTSTGTYDWVVAAWVDVNNSGIIDAGDTQLDSYESIGTLTVAGSIPGTVSVSGGGTYCNSTTLTASGGSGGTIYWQGTTNNGESTATPSSSQTVSSSGTYYFRARSNCGWGTQGSVTVTINSTPGSATINQTGTPCAGNALTFTANASNATSYSWSAPGWNPSSGSGASFTTTPSGSGNISVTPSNSCGNGAVATQFVNVTSRVVPSVTIAASPSGTVCSNTSVTFTASPTNGGNNPSYVWYVNGNQQGSGATYSSSALLNSNQVTCQMTSNANCASPTQVTSNSVTMSITSPSSVSISPSNPPTGCNPITLTATQCSGCTYSWSQNGGNGQSTGSSNQFTASTSGNYTVTATVNGCAGSPSTSVNVTLDNSVAASFTGLPSSMCASGSAVTLSGTPSGGTFNGNGISGNQFNPATSGGGSHQVTYTYNDPNTGCSGTNVQTVVVGNPSPNITGNTSYCEGGNTTLDAGSGFVSYNWNNGAGFTQLLSVSSPGVYTVLVTDANLCTNQANVTVTENANPTPTLPATQTYCQGQNTFLSAPAGYSSYLWTPGGTANQILSVNSPGVYSVTVTDANGCLGISNQTSVSESTQLSPTIVVQGGVAAAICAGGSLQLNAGLGYSLYNWSTGGFGQFLTVSAPGTYTIIVTQGGCQGTASIEVSQYPTPIANAGADQIITPPATSAALNGSANGGSGSGYSYSWSPTTGLDNPALPNPNASPNQTTDYTLTVTDGNGCTATDEVNVTNSGGCESSTLSATSPAIISAIGGSGVSNVSFTPGVSGCTWSVSMGSDCEWLSNISPLSAQTGNNTIQVTAGPNGTEGVRTCTLTITHDGGTETVIVQQNPIQPDLCIPPMEPPHVVLNGCELSTAQVNGVSYQWYVSGNAVGNGTRFHQVLVTGTYYVVITDGDGCTAQSADYYIEFIEGECITSINDLSDTGMGISLVPNPNSGSFELIISELKGLQGFEVFSSLGQLIRSGTITSERTAIDMQGAAAGIYLFRVLDERGQMKGISRLVIQD